MLEPERPAAEAVQDILKNVKHQIDPLDEPDAEAARDRDIAAILSGSDFQAILDESLRESEDVSGASSGKPAAGQSAFPADSAPLTAGRERPSPFGTALGSLKNKIADPSDDTPAGETQGGSGTFDGDLFFLDNGADTGAADPLPDSVARKPRRWWGSTRQILYLLLLLLVCLFLFRLFGPKKKVPTIEDFFQPGNPDIEFLDAVNYLEKYYERHPELKRGKQVQQSDEDLTEPVSTPRAWGGTESDASGSSPETAAGQGNAPAPAEPAH